MTDDLRELKAGAAAVDPEDYNALIDAVVAGGGGGSSLPAPTVAAVLASIAEPEEGATSAPTLAEIDTSYNVFTEWTAERDYSAPFAFNADMVAVLLPTGSVNVFSAEINGAATGTEEPDWDGDAPTVGDDISDGDVTWVNIGPQSAWPPAPVTFEVDTEYPAMTLLWPTVPNGHLYLVYPPGPYTAAAEPDPWPIKGAYESGDNGYVYDLGTKLSPAYAGGDLSILGIPSSGMDAVALARLFIHIRDRVGYVPGLSIVTSENGYIFLAVNNETFISNHPEATAPPLSMQLVEGGGVQISHNSETPGDDGVAYQLGIGTDNALNLSATLALRLAGATVELSASGLPADGDLANSVLALHPHDTNGLELKFKTSGGSIKTATIPWD